MKNFITTWKKLATEKNASNADTLTYCILRSINAKSPEKEAVLMHYLGKAYSPSTKKNHPYEAVHSAAREISWKYQWSKTLLGTKSEDIFETEDEVNLFNELLVKAVKYDK